MYRVIHKSLRDFWPLRYSSRDGHAEGERVNRGRDTPIFCPTSQVLDMSTLGDTADVKPVIKFLPRDLPQLRQRILEAVIAIDRQMLQCEWQELDYRIDIAASPRVDISSTCKVRQKLGVSLPLLTCSPLALPSQLLYRRGRKSQRDLWITLYLGHYSEFYPATSLLQFVILVVWYFVNSNWTAALKRILQEVFLFLYHVFVGKRITWEINQYFGLNEHVMNIFSYL
jgi:hypothetical protein